MKKKLIATFEVLGILVIGWTLTRMLITVLGVPPLQDYLDKAILSDSPNFIYLSKIGFITLFIQFLSLMIPAYMVTKLLHKESLKKFGITKGIKTTKENLLIGVIFFCLLGIPMKLLLITNHFIVLGMEPSYWEIFNKNWNWGFWLFMAVGSFAVIPIFEELFYRGYAQYRLEKDFKFFSVLFISLLFVSTHFQYYVIDIFNAGMLCSLLILAIGMAFSRHISASILTPIIIHSLMNIPAKYPYDIFVLILMILVIVLLRKKVAKLVKEFFFELKRTDLKGSSFYFLFIIAFAVGMNFLPEITLLILLLLFLTSLVIQISGKKKLKN